MDRTEVQQDEQTRRAFLNRALLGSLSVFAVAFGGGSIGMLWPEVKRNTFGGKFDAGKLDAILQEIDNDPPIGIAYRPAGKFYLVRYDTSDPNNRYVRDGVATRGIMAIYQKCSHLGCRVPFCPTSQLFECACHGASFNRAGERRGGPAPAGMWRFKIEVDESDNVIVDTRSAVSQPPMGTDTVGMDPAGAFCVVCE